ncbi:uracil phosphoribosyltransferase [Porphyromonas macacae]|uniref:Uracil phosphoribosyltransferase n=1 Tax=Porphyromonas macacae TaxID=28115 RepID=A0A0A2EA03_9PORP|nr:uracil phosphoribosyltransferase [Porphyromonas macacae]KGN74462.1 uracil phosphoribosyltransferase [Porphyromonas macacae]SUB88920.1 Uracil phosphoribosyltransferase [Porphyromonas macacae]
MNTIHLLSENTILCKYLSEMRDCTIQKDRLRFRRNIERCGEIIAYEISKQFEYKQIDVNTPLGCARCSVPNSNLVVGTILRAGLPFHQGFLSYLDGAENAFVSAYRKYKDRLNFDIFIEYIASPDLTGKTLVLVDPMLATGGSMELAYKALLTKGKPKKVYMASVIASEHAVSYLEKTFADEDITLWVADIDPHLDEHSYIVPGLGDAGDLAFGEKL